MLTAPDVLTVEEAATLLRLSTKTVLKRLATGELAGVRGEGKRSHWRITREAIDDYLGRKIPA